MSFFRNLFSRRSAADNSPDTVTVPTQSAAPAAVPVATPAAAPMTAHAAAPVTMAAAPAATVTEQTHAHFAAAVPPMAAPVAPPASTNGIAPTACPPDCIPFPLKAITDNFPVQLMGVMRKSPSEHILVNIPRALVAPQLASGAVRMTLAQLRAVTPEVFFRPDPVHDTTQIQLPLDIVLKLMMPARRPDQQRPTIPVNIPSVFATKIPAVQPRAGAPAAGADQWYSQRRPVYTPPDSDGEPEQDPAASHAALNGGDPHLANGHHSLPVAVEQPVIAPPPPAPSSFLPNPEPFPSAPTPQPAPASTLPPPAPEPPAPVAATPVAPAAQQIPDGSFAIPMTAVIGALPGQIVAILNSAPARPSAFIIPLEQIESRMRTGKLRFAWAQLREWCGAPESASVPPDMEVDLPLATVVPLFMAARKSSEPRKKVEVDARIPDVFGKTTFPAAAESETEDEPPAPAAEAAPAPAPHSAAAPEPAPALSSFLPTAADSLPAPASILPSPRTEPAAPPPAPEPPPAAAAPSFRLERSDAPSQPISAPPPEIPVAPVDPLPYKLERAPSEAAPAPEQSSQPTPEPVVAPISTFVPQPEPTDASATPAAAAATFIPEPEPASIAPAATAAEPFAAQPEPATQLPASYPVHGQVPVAPPIAAAPPAPIAAPTIAPVAAAVPTPPPAPATIPFVAPPPAPAAAAAPIPVVVTAAAAAASNTHQDPPTNPGPALLVRTIRALEGVSGVFMATADGLLIASDMPNANENLLAAFAPTVFSQMTKYSGMARLGPPESIDLNLGTACIHVRKAGNVFLGVLLPPGTTLPRMALPLIANFLKPHNP